MGPASVHQSDAVAKTSGFCGDIGSITHHEMSFRATPSMAWYVYCTTAGSIVVLCDCAPSVSKPSLMACYLLLPEAVLSILILSAPRGVSAAARVGHRCRTSALEQDVKAGVVNPEQRSQTLGDPFDMTKHAPGSTDSTELMKHWACMY